MRCPKRARSFACARRARRDGAVSSNIVWSYGHTTIPRHLRDIVVTEYGIADLRGRTDREIVEALVGIMDARFQDGFRRRRAARRQIAAGLARARRSPRNQPSNCRNVSRRGAASELFAELPFGTDFTAEEIVLAKALRALQAATHSWPGKVSATLRALLADATAPQLQPYLARMELTAPRSFNERLQRGLVVVALEALRKSQAEA